MNEKVDKVKKTSGWRGWIFFLPVVFIFAILLLIIGYFSLPIIQESITKFVVKEVNSTFAGELEYEEIKVLGNKIEIDNFLWKGYCNDTIAEVERLELYLNIGLFSFLTKSYNIDKLLIKNGYYKQTKYLGDSTSNVTLAFKMGKKNQDANMKPLVLLMDNPTFVDFCYLIEDENNSSNWSFCTGLFNAERIIYDNENKGLKFIGAISNSMDFELEFKKASSYAYIAPPPKPEVKYLTLEFQDAIFCNSHLKFDNYRSDIDFEVDQSVDYNHIELNNMELEIKSFYNYLLEFNVEDFSLSGVEKSGWNISKFGADQLDIGCERTDVSNLLIQIDSSRLESNITFSYPEGYKSWLDFPNKVKIKNQSKLSVIYPNDLFHLSPGLRNNKFLAQNKNKKFRFRGDIIGYVNRLRFRKFEFNYDDHTFINGQLTLRDLTGEGNSFISLSIDEMSSEAKRIREAFDGLKIPRSFDKLGRFNFKGTYDGTSSDFIAYGNIRSNVGVAKVDVNMRNLSTSLIPEYSGELKLEDFDLGLWSANDKLGKFNLVAKVKEGKGLKSDNAEAILEADVSNIVFNDYQYQNINYKGIFSKNQLKGEGTINDESIQLFYSGDIEIVDNNYIVNAELDIQELKMKELHFSNREFNISAQSDLNFKTNNLLDFVGYAKLDSLVLTENGHEYFLDEFNVYSLEYGEGQHLNIIGQGFEARIDGNYKLKNFYKSTINTLYRENRSIAEILNFKYYPEVDNEINDFEIQLRIDSLKGWTKMLLPHLERVDDLDLFLAHNEEYRYFDASLKTPNLNYNNLRFEEVDFSISLEKGVGKLEYTMDSLLVGNSVVPSITTLFNIDRDDIDFALVSEDQNDFFDNVNLNGQVELQDSLINLSLNEGNVVLFNDLWKVSKGNSLTIYKNSLEAKYFYLINADKAIEIRTTENDRVEINLTNFDLDKINQFIPTDALNVTGSYDALIEFDNLLSLKNINILGSSDQFLINNDDYGKLQFSASLVDLKSMIDGDLVIYKGKQVLHARFDHNMTETNRRKAHYTDVWAEVNKYPAHFLDYFAGESISETIGEFSSDFKVEGYPQELHIDGLLTLDTFATTVVFLNSRVNLSNQTLSLKDSLMECLDCFIYDHEGNMAQVKGGIRHNYLSELEYDIHVLSDNFKVLDTEKGSNQYFYGQAYAGDMDVSVLGPLSKPDLIVRASSNPNSKLIFPLTSELVSVENRFIVFGKKEEDLLIESIVKKSGMNFSLNLDVNENATISIIFDEKSNDKITAKGNGNISLTYDDTGEVGVFGNYDISEGKYLFTFSSFINKPFILREGSHIQFVGSPYDAILGITADYKGLSSPVYPLIQEYLTDNQQLESLAKSPTIVDLSMILTGELFSPQIDFGINFPELDRQLKNFADAKINTLGDLENDLNRQVFGLLIVGSFLPSEQAQIQGTQVITNTVSQMISSQLSNYLTGLLSDLILTENSIISDFEFDLGYNFYNSGSSAGVVTKSSEVSVNPRFYLLDGRVVLDVSGNYNNSQFSKQTNALTGNFAIGIELTEDRKWLFRAYQRFEPDFDGSDRSKTGVGLSYRTDFNRIKLFTRKLNEKHIKNQN